MFGATPISFMTQLHQITSAQMAYSEIIKCINEKKFVFLSHLSAEIQEQKQTQSACHQFQLRVNSIMHAHKNGYTFKKLSVNYSASAASSATTITRRAEK